MIAASPATQHNAAPPNGTQPPAGPPPLWGEIEIPIMIGTGEFGQGKTLMGLTICPGPQTLVMDNEGSSLTYRGLDFDHIDMASELTTKFPKGYTAQDRYLWFREEAIRRGRVGGRAGRYRVLVVDPASEIEDGMADYLRANITKYGLTQPQCDRSPALFWGVMKREWKALLDQLRVLYETVYITVHLRDEFRGGAPTGKREPKGKETLFELASLFLWFEREKDKAGNVSAVPSATVLKSRLAKTLFLDGELKIVPVLPPRLPVATPKAIRDYIATPPDYDHLKKAERVADKVLTEDEKPILQNQIAANQAIAAQAENSRLEKFSAAAKAQAEARQNVRPAPDQAGEHAQSRQDHAADSVHPASQELLTEIRGLINGSFASEQEARDVMPALLSGLGAAKVADLNEQQAESLKIELLRRRSVELQRRAGEKLAAAGTTPATTRESNDPTATRAAGPEPIGPELAQQIRQALPGAYASPAECQTGFAALLATFGASKIADLNEAQGANVLQGLRQLASTRQEYRTTPPDQPDQPVSTSATPDQQVSLVPREVLEKLRATCIQRGFTHEQQAAWLAARGLGSFRSATADQLGELFSELDGIPF